MKKLTKKEKIENGIIRYHEEWGNYKTDDHKSKRILRAEITCILIHAFFSRKELLEILNHLRKKMVGNI